LFVGSYSGKIFYYDDIDANLMGSFTLIDSSFEKIYEGVQCVITGIDMDADSAIDLIIGNYCGGVSFYRGFDSLLTEIPVESSNIDFSIYPNPAHEVTTISFSEPTSGELSVMDILGQKLFTFPLRNSKAIHLDSKHLNAGTYFCNLKTERGEKSKILIVIR
jgi:hypothetical protein